MNQKIIAAIRDYMVAYVSDKGTTWREPVIGFAHAENPGFAQLKTVIGPTHALPQELLPGAKSIIVFFLPFAKDIVDSNIGQVQSSKLWDIANIETNQLIYNINVMLNQLISQEGHQSTLLPATYNYDEKLLLSDWSHRHVAYLAGVGTFGIHNLLITDQGCCGRIGSVITTLDLNPTPQLVQENCLYKHNGTCGACAKRCVANAITLGQGYPYVDREQCNQQVYDDAVPVYDIGLGDACGKCMCGVPCSTRNPRN